MAAWGVCASGSDPYESDLAVMRIGSDCYRVVRIGGKLSAEWRSVSTARKIEVFGT